MSYADENLLTDSVERKVELAWLAAFYSGMLTERQRQVLSLYCEEDMSLGEIAREEGTSRQAVHETVTRAAARLTEMEERLHMGARFRAVEQGLEESLRLLRENRSEEAQAVITRLLREERLSPAPAPD